ncbi:MAG: hypothetical protein Q4C70_04635 [Planctomycetia bacterium]|nr:hypothetical protein [Planctomycetia bacterium]
MSTGEELGSHRLLLYINWGGCLQLNAQLCPNFMLMAYGLREKPEITFELDANLRQNAWEEQPKPIQYESHDPDFQGAVWEFHESLAIDPITPPEGDATYGLTLTVSFHEHENGLLRTYRFRELIKLEAKKNVKKELIINASHGSVINTDLDWGKFDRLEINADKAAINQSRRILEIMEQKNSANKADSEGEQKPLVLNMRRVVSASSVVADAENIPVCRQLLIKAEMPKGVRFFYLYALPKVVIGRDYRKAQVVYRFYRENVVKDSPQGYLSLFISGEHVEMNFTEEGIEFQTHSTWGAEVFRDADDKKSRLREDILSWDELEELEEPEIRLSRFASLPMNIYRKQVPLLVKKNLVESGKLRMRESNLDPLWYLGEERNVSALKLSRKKDFSWKNGDGKDGKEETVIPEPNFEANRKRWENENAWKSDPYADDVEYFFVFQAVSLGSHITTDAVYFNTDQLCTQHLTFCYCSDHFELANNDSRAIFYTLPGHEKEYLYKNELLPLMPGMTFEVGTLRFSVWKDYREYLEYARSFS